MKTNFDGLSKDTIYLYCINKQSLAENGCNDECLDERCLCMDNRQFGLIGYLEGIIEDIPYEDGEILDEGRGSFPDELFCGREAAKDKRLVNCRLRSKDYHFHVTRAAVMASCLPVIQATNSLHCISSRDTLFYLCLYGKNGGKFIIKFLVEKVVIPLIENFPSKMEMRRISNQAEVFFGKLNNMFYNNSDSEEVSLIRQNIGQYWKSLDDEMLGPISDCLKTYYNQLCKKEEYYNRKISVCNYIFVEEVEQRKVCFLYWMVNYLLSMNGCNSVKAIDEFFGKIQKKSAIDNDGEYSEIAVLTKDFIYARARGDVGEESEREKIAKKLKEFLEIEILERTI